MKLQKVLVVKRIIIRGFSCPFWAAAPTGDKVLYNGEEFCMSVHTSIFGWPSDPAEWPSDPAEGGGWTDGYEWTEFLPILPDFIPCQGSALPPFETSQHQRSMAWVPLTMYTCTHATRTCKDMIICIRANILRNRFTHVHMCS